MRNIIGIFLSLLLLSLVVLLPEETSYAWGDKTKVLRVTKEESQNKNFSIHERVAPVSESWNLLLSRAKRDGWRGSLNGSLSGLRTKSEQRELYHKFIRGEGPPAFHPNGPSRHIISNVRGRGGWFQAVDVSNPEELTQIAASFGVNLWQPYAGEPWHVEARKPFSVEIAKLERVSYQVSESGISWLSAVLSFFAGLSIAALSSNRRKAVFIIFLGLSGALVLAPPYLLFLVFGMCLAFSIKLSLGLIRQSLGHLFSTKPRDFEPISRQRKSPFWLEDVVWTWPDRG